MDKHQCQELIANNLETHDKRFLFMKLFFKELTSRINLEGSAYQAAWQMYFEFKKHSRLEELQTILLKYFG